MRGIYNGEIQDRTHLFSILGFLFMLFWVEAIPIGKAYKYVVRSQAHDLQNALIYLLVGIILAWIVILLAGREFVFLTINKNIIRIKRPLLKLSPLKKDKTQIEIPIKEISEINIVLPPRRRATRTWRFVSHEGKELAKICFEPEFIFSTVDLQDYFEKNGIDIKIT